MKVTDYQHEGWCDTQNNISNSCNCIVGYPLEVIEGLEKKVEKLRDALKTIKHTECDTYKIASKALFKTSERT